MNNRNIFFPTQSTGPVTFTQILSNVSTEISDAVNEYPRLTASIAQLYYNPEAANHELIRRTRLRSSALLLRKLEYVSKNLPVKKSVLKILSLACGIPDEFLAIKAFMKKHNPNCSVSFTGIDIDKEHNKINRETFKNFSEFSIIEADGSNILSVLNNLADKLPDDGFDIIFLRHPDVNSVRGPVFRAMIQEIIPQLAASQCTVIFSAYYDFELDTIHRILSANQNSWTMPKKNYLEATSSGKDKEIVHDKYFLLAHCQGLTNNKKLHHLRHDLNFFNFEAAIKKVCKADTEILNALHNKNFSIILRRASSIVQIPLLKIILNNKNIFAIDLNEVIDGWTALDCLEQAKNVLPVLKTAAIKMLSAEGAKKSSDILTTASKPR